MKTLLYVILKGLVRVFHLRIEQGFAFTVDKVYWSAGVNERSTPVDASCEQRWACYEPPVSVKMFALVLFTIC